MTLGVPENRLFLASLFKCNISYLWHVASTFMVPLHLQSISCINQCTVMVCVCYKSVGMLMTCPMSVCQSDGDTAVRFFDDMDVPDRQLHTLHQSIRDLNSGHQQLRQELEEERLRRTRCGMYTLCSRNTLFLN